MAMALVLQLLGVSTSIAPTVGIFVMPVQKLEVERASIPETTKKPVKPKAPNQSAPEADWNAYRQQMNSYEAILSAYLSTGTRHSALVAAQRAARATRALSDKKLVELGYSIEYNLRQMSIFKVLSDYQTKYPTGFKCQADVCLEEVAAKSSSSSLIVLMTVSGSTEAAARWVTFDAVHPAGQTIADHTMVLGRSAREAIKAFAAPALRWELRAALEMAKRSASALDWKAMRFAAQRALMIDGHNALAHTLSGRALFELGELSSAETQLRLAEDQLPDGVPKGEVAQLRALIFLRWRREDLAQDAFMRALSMGAGGFEARLFVGRSLVEQHAQQKRGDAESVRSMLQAEKTLRAALDERPRHGEANYLLGMVYLWQGNVAHAVPAFLAAVDADYRAPEAHLHLGMLAGAAGKLSLAQRHLELAHMGGQQSAASLLLMGHILRHSDKKRALSILQRARALGIVGSAHGLHFDIDMVIAGLAMDLQDLTTAITAFRRASTRSEQAVAAHTRLEAIALEQNNIPQAAVHRRVLIDLGQDTSAGREVLARAAALRGRVEEEEGHLRAGLKLSSHYVQLNLHLARLLFKHKGAVAARPYYLKVEKTALTPHAEVERALGLADVETGRLHSAVKHLRSAIQNGPQDERLLRSLARSLNQIDDSTPAQRQEIWKLLIEHNPGDAEASLNLGLLFFQAADHDAALPFLRHASGSRTYRAQAHQVLGDIAFADDRAQEALTHYLASARYAPADVDLLMAIGKVAELLGDLETARHYVVRALAFYPQDIRLLRKAVELYKRTGHTLNAELLLQRRTSQ